MTPTTRLALAAALFTASFTSGCAPHDSVEAAKTCDDLATKGEHKEASKCLFDLVNEPARATRASTYDLWDDEAGVVITSKGRVKMIDGAEMRAKMVAQIPVMEATGANDTFEDVTYYTPEELAELEETPAEAAAMLQEIEEDVVFIRATRVSSKDDSRRPFVLGMADVEGKWRIVAHFMEVL